jgi:hypothetical protein
LVSSPGTWSETADLAETVRHRVDVATSTGATNRWLEIDLGRAAAYPDRVQAGDTLLTFTSGPLTAGVHVLGFPVVTMRLATSGTDGAVYVYLEDVDPSGEVAYLTEGCLRFLHRRTPATLPPASPGRARRRKPSPSNSAATPTSTSRLDTAEDGRQPGARQSSRKIAAAGQTPNRGNCTRHNGGAFDTATTGQPASHGTRDLGGQVPPQATRLSLRFQPAEDFGPPADAPRHAERC